jgi:hypothetical protein
MRLALLLDAPFLSDKIVVVLFSLLAIGVLMKFGGAV